MRLEVIESIFCTKKQMIGFRENKFKKGFVSVHFFCIKWPIAVHMYKVTNLMEHTLSPELITIFLDNKVTTLSQVKSRFVSNIFVYFLHMTKVSYKP